VASEEVTDVVVVARLTAALTGADALGAKVPSPL
jgi:hypothetical protein